jgi:hypothetical protein
MTLTPAMRRRATAHLTRTLHIPGGVIAGLVAVSTSPHHAPRDFFDIAAQIIVVLLLAAGLQTRLLSTRVKPLPPPIELPPNPSEILRALLRLDGYMVAITGAYYALGTAVILVVGELAALGMLLGTATTGNPQAVLFCITYGLVALTIAALLGGPDEAGASD